jgi:uncharacterized membrane protein YcaP (DUF421 family)
MNRLFFDSWESIIRTLVITVLAYLLLVFLLRVSGKRTLSKMNAFDFIVTIALGSTLATVILNKSVALADGILAFFLLIVLQYIMTYMEARSKNISNLIKATPSLLVYKGRMLKATMLEERVNEDEIHAVVRKSGLASMQDVGAVILETDGTLTLIHNIDTLNTPVMKDVGK